MEAIERYYKQWNTKSELLKGYYSGAWVLLQGA